jgi:hypothetical protein
MATCNKAIKSLMVGDFVECVCDNSYAGWGIVTKSEGEGSFAFVLFFDVKYQGSLAIYPFEVMNVLRDGVKCFYDP